MIRVVKIFLFLVCVNVVFAQSTEIVLSGIVSSDGGILPGANVWIKELKTGVSTDLDGEFEINIPKGNYTIVVSFVGYNQFVEKIKANSNLSIEIKLDPSSLNEVVVTGTQREVRKMESAVPVDVYTPKFFKKNPTPNMYEALQNVNGVRPQINCNVCNTGDIHINGLEGPYTMIVIDGAPVVSGLSTVYGLSGIPTSMIEQMEIVKGPASSLYGSEAVGGLINVITKSPNNAPKFSADIFTTTWLEHNADIGFVAKINNRLSVLTGINAYSYNNPIDNNNDNFTDVSLQDRVSVFQKYNIKRKSNKSLSLSGRYFTENRWGGELQWTEEDRGGTNRYGESIITKRWEMFGVYELPTMENLKLSASYNAHNQDSYYGDMPYMGQQNIAFSQLTWTKDLNRHQLLGGLAYRHTYYDDNTNATQELQADSSFSNLPSVYALPGIFIQDDILIDDKNRLLIGYRNDYHSEHGFIHTPRIAYKYSISEAQVLRLNMGSGFRVVNLFTEEHAALTGARNVEILENLNPERSYNANLNYVGKFYAKNGYYIGVDAAAWITHFENQILPDYDTDPNKIIYKNLNGYSRTAGVALNLDLTLPNQVRLLAGATLMDISVYDENEAGELEKIRPVLTERVTGTWSLSVPINRYNMSLDYTGNLYGPMRLPLLGNLDPRDEYSPWWSIQNIQVTWDKKSSPWAIYGGVKNLLNFTPAANSIARAHDPFDREVEFDANGDVIATANNPNALTFDPSYVYAPNQGIRGFIGVRYEIR